MLCVLYKSPIDIEPLLLTIHGVNTCFIDHLSNVENYSEADWPKQKKNCVLENIVLHLYACFGVKIQNTNGQNFLDICKIDT